MPELSLSHETVQEAPKVVLVRIGGDVDIGNARQRSGLRQPFPQARRDRGNPCTPILFE